MKKTEMMKRYEAETGECATWTWHEREFLTDDYIAWLEAQLRWRPASEKLRKLGEQWIEEIDGKKHMLKAVNYSEGCNGCIFLRYNSYEFYTCDRGRLGCPVDNGMIIKDLGILNEDGCLPAPWDKELYPDFYHASKTLWCVHAESNDLEMKAVGNSKQEAIDAWNRRM